jgi:hypothetical protein
MTTNIFFTPLLCCCFGIWDPGSEIQDPGWVKIRIRDKHPGFATLMKRIHADPETWIKACRIQASGATYSGAQSKAVAERPYYVQYFKN